MPSEASSFVSLSYRGQKPRTPGLGGFDSCTYLGPISEKGPKPLRVVASRKGGREVAFLYPPWCI